MKARRKKGGMAKGRGRRRDEGQEEERRYGKGERKDRGRREKGGMAKGRGRRREEGHEEERRHDEGDMKKKGGRDDVEERKEEVERKWGRG